MVALALVVFCRLPLLSWWVVLLSSSILWVWCCRSPTLFFEVKFKYRNKPNYIDLNSGRLWGSWPPPPFRGAAFLSLLEGGVVSFCASPLVGGACLPSPPWVWCCFPLRLSPCGWCCLPSPPLAGAVVAPSFFGKVLLSSSPFGWHCSIPSSLEAAFLILFSCFPASSLGLVLLFRPRRLIHRLVSFFPMSFQVFVLSFFAFFPFCFFFFFSIFCLFIFLLMFFIKFSLFFFIFRSVSLPILIIHVISFP